MLVLKRLVGEVVVINDKIKVTVVDIDRGKVKLGVECDRSIPVVRKELLDRSKEKS